MADIQWARGGGVIGAMQRGELAEPIDQEEPKTSTETKGGKKSAETKDGDSFDANVKA
jgi:hypothetical protein